MNPSTTEILNRLLVLHERSLAVYLSFAAPEHIEKSPRIGEVLRHMAADHQRTVDRLGTLILWDPLESTCRHASLSIL